jgi:hypothetical protein
MPFHRLTVPSYTGGLPSGFDYLNNATSGTPAASAGPKVGGVNAGTYFTAYQDDATSESANRAHKALGENCDYLDNLLRRDIAVRAKTAFVIAGAPISSITVSEEGQYFGESDVTLGGLVSGISTFAEVVDPNGDPIFNGGTQVLITSITGATVGTGFSNAASVTYNLTPDIPNGSAYVLLYSKRSNLAEVPANLFAQLKNRSTLGHLIRYSGSGAATWADATALPVMSV